MTKCSLLIVIFSSLLKYCVLFCNDDILVRCLNLIYSKYLAFSTFNKHRMVWYKSVTFVF